MYLPFVSKGLKTYPGLPGTALAVGNLSSVEEEVSGDGEEVHTIAFARKETSLRLPVKRGSLLRACAHDVISRDVRLRQNKNKCRPHAGGDERLARACKYDQRPLFYSHRATPAARHARRSRTYRNRN
jgi:hypothetical protein